MAKTALLLAFSLLFTILTPPVWAQDGWTDELEPGVSLFSASSFRRLPEVRDLTLSPNDQWAYFTVVDSSGATAIWEMHRLGRSWSSAKQSSFSEGHRDLDPSFSPDGQRLYFASDRPEHEGDGQLDMNLWFMEKKEGGEWGEPHPLPALINGPGDEFYPSVAASGNVYFTAAREGGLGQEDIYVSRWQGGAYQEPELLQGGVNTPGYEFNAYVAPDESFLVFSSDYFPDCEGEADLYYSFRQPDGTWSEAIHFPTPINSPHLEHCPTVDAQRQVLYFTRKERGKSRLYQVNFAYLMEMMR